MREAEGHADAPAYANPPPPLSEPSDHREGHARRCDALPSGAGRDPPRAGSARYALAQPTSAREPLGAPTRSLSRWSSRERQNVASARGGALGGDPFARTDRASENLFPRPDARRVRSGASRWSRAPASVAPSREGDPRDAAPPRAQEAARAAELRNREPALYGFPGDATRPDVRRSLETCGVPPARAHAFTDRLYVCPTYSAIRDVPNAECVAACARARAREDAERARDRVDSGGTGGGPPRFRDSPLAAMRWDAPRPGVLAGIPHTPPPEVGGVEVTRRFVAEPVLPRGRAEERSAREPRAPPPATMPHPEWLGPNRCAVHACGQMGRLIGHHGACVIGMKNETGCEIKKLDHERMVVEGATQTLVERGVERVRREVSTWLRRGALAGATSAGDGRRASNTAAANRTIVPRKPSLGFGVTASPLEAHGRDLPTPASAEPPLRGRAEAPSARASAASAESRGGADALSDTGEANGEMCQGGAEGKRDALADDDQSAWVRGVEGAGLAADDAEGEPEGGAGEYDVVADFSDCLPPGETRDAGVFRAERAAATEEPEPNPEAEVAPVSPPGEPKPTAEADDAQPPPPPPPPASPPPPPPPPAAADSAEDEAPAAAPPANEVSPTGKVSPRERLLLLVAARQISRDTLERRIADALDPTRAPDPDPALRLSPEAEVSREARNLFVRHRVSAKRAASGYRVSRALRAAPDASAREKTRAKPSGWRLAQDWTLALDEGDEAPPGGSPEGEARADARSAPGAARDGVPARGLATRRAASPSSTFASRVSNAACTPAEVDAWVARRFRGDCAEALSVIESAPVPATARKRPAPSAGATAAKRRRGDA